MGQYLFTSFYILVDKEFHWEIYYRVTVSSRMKIFVSKDINSRHDAVSKHMYQLLYNGRDPCKNMYGLGFANWVILNRIDRE